LTIVRVAAAALNQTPLDWDGNTRNILAALREARERHVHVICLPELCITGYGCEDAFFAEHVAETAWKILTQDILPESAGLMVSVGLPFIYRDQRFNCAALLADRKLVGIVGKQNLAGDGLHYEPRWFRPWPNNIWGTVETSEGPIPIGDLAFDFEGIRIGFEICEDAWVLQRPGGELARLGVDILLNPSASHFAFGKAQIRERLVLDAARTFHTVYVYANLVGNEAGRAIYDGDTLIGVGDTIAARGPRLGFRDVYMTAVNVDLAAVRRRRLQAKVGRMDQELAVTNLIKCSYSWPALPTELESERPNVLEGWEKSPTLKEEEFGRAVSLGLFDYLRKSRLQGFVISLSGGADSSAAAVLVSTMLQLALKELGEPLLKEKLSHCTRMREESDFRDLLRALLTCVYQATRNSGLVTRRAASHVAQRLGAAYYELEVDHIVQDYVLLIGEALDRPIEWATDDIALQNVQARTRGPSVWLIANLLNSLLISTSNRSEAAVGYATMDGDTCGGLAPLAGIDKAFLRSWLVWMEQCGLSGLERHPELSVVNEQAPTAELRPPGKKQTDESDLMPYPVLDAIERCAIRDRRSPEQCLEHVTILFSMYSRRQMAEWVIRFFRLWSRNQWKRERYAPSFHLDDENLDPKTWCRFPILSGGFQRELRELENRELLDLRNPTP
jgi:NAD+ synthase (glutamine-hydrolysing)